MNAEPSVIRRPGRGVTGQPEQVLVNHARMSRGPWSMRAWLDKEGAAVKGNFLVARSQNPDVPGLLLWALLNSPVANAFVYAFSSKRHIIGGDLLSLPIPVLASERANSILAAAQTFFATASARGGFFQAEPDSGTVKRALLELDAAVLRAYDLPPRLERQLLDLFTGIERKGVGLDGPDGKSTFRGYYPPGFTSALPLHMVISEQFERARADKTAERFKPGDSPHIRDLLRAVASAKAEV